MTITAYSPGLATGDVTIVGMTSDPGIGVIRQQDAFNSNLADLTVTGAVVSADRVVYSGTWNFLGGSGPTQVKLYIGNFASPYNVYPLVIGSPPVSISDSDSGKVTESTNPTRLTEVIVEAGVKTAGTTRARISAVDAEVAISTTLRLTLGGSDSGRSVETTSIFVPPSPIAAADVATGTDTEVVSLPLSSSDSGSFGEAVSLAQADSDGGVFTDGAISMATPTASDASVGTDVGTIFVAQTGNDAGSISEAGFVSNFLTKFGADTGTGADSSSLAVGATDAAIGIDSTVLAASVQAFDNANLVANESLAATPAAADTATGADAASPVRNYFDATATLGRSRSLSGAPVVLLRKDATATAARSRTVSGTAVQMFARLATATLGRSRTVGGSGVRMVIQDVSATLRRSRQVGAAGALGGMFDITATLSRSQDLTATTSLSDVLPPENPTLLVQFAGPTLPDGTVPTNPDGSLNVSAGGVISISIASGDPGDIIEVTLDTSTDSLAEVALDESGSAFNVSVPLPASVLSGLHQVVVTGQTSGTGYVVVSIPFDPAAQPPTAGPDPAPPSPDVALWSLEDPITGEIYELPIGPSPDGVDSPFMPRPLSTDVTTSPAGQVITWEGAKRAQAWTLSGRLVTQDQYNRMVAWSERAHRTYLHDPLGRVWLIKITAFQSKPVTAPMRSTGSGGNNWVHDWTMATLVYGRRA